MWLRRRLVKLAFPGGVLALNDREIVLAEGVFGSGRTQRFALNDLVRLEVLQAAQPQRWRGLELRLLWRDGSETLLAGVGPLAARRLVLALRALQIAVDEHE